MYQLHVGQHGNVQWFKKIAQQRFSTESPEYEELCRWVQTTFTDRPFSPDQGFPPNHNLLLSSDVVVDYCKHSGVRLYADISKEFGRHSPSTLPLGLLPEGEKTPFVLGGSNISPERGLINLDRVQEWRQARFASVDLLAADTGIAGTPSDLIVPLSVWIDICNKLQDESSDIHRLSSLPVTRTFVYVDVSDFSTYKPGKQALIIDSLVGLVHFCPDLWNAGFGREVFEAKKEAFCIGDGYIYVFEHAGFAAYFAAYLAQLIEVLVAHRELPEFHFRMGVHVGPVYSFWDAGPQRWNYIGDGINGGNRVLAAVGNEQDDVVFSSGQVRQELEKDRGMEPEPILDCLANRGRKKDKHGNAWRVYELNHTKLCGEAVAASYQRWDKSMGG